MAIRLNEAFTKPEVEMEDKTSNHKIYYRRHFTALQISDI